MAGAFVVGEVIAVPLAEIHQAEKRLLPRHAPTVDRLVGLMAQDGQLTPIEVCRLPGREGFHLVSGAHRLAAARRLAWPAINAILVGASAMERRTRELHENLSHRELAPLDHAASIAELCALARSWTPTVDAPETVKEQSTKAFLNLRNRYCWADDVADKIGLSRASLYRALAIAKNLLPELAEAVRNDPIAQNAQQLYGLSKLTPKQQRAIAAGMRAGQTSAYAVPAVIGRAAADPPQKAHDAFVGSFGRIPARGLETALRDVAAQAVRRGWKVTYQRIAI